MNEFRDKCISKENYIKHKLMDKAGLMNNEKQNIRSEKNNIITSFQKE